MTYVIYMGVFLIMEKIEQKNQPSNPERKFIAADLEKCSGCGTCELICAIKRENQYNSRCSRIKILRNYRLVNLAMTCRLCDDAPCVIACPQKCLVQSEKTGAILVDDNECDCCGLCMEVCPYGAISLHPEKETVLICDLCEGEPQCIEWCPEEALGLVTQKELDENILRATEKILLEKTLGLSKDEPNKTNKKKLRNKAEKIDNYLIQKAKQKKSIMKSMNLLFDAFSETNPIEILVYGMFVKKRLSTMVPTGSKDKIEITLEWLEEAIRLIEEYMLSNPEILVSMNNRNLGNFEKIGD